MNDCPVEGLEPVEYDDETNTFQAGFDSAELPPSHAVVKVVSEVCDTQPTDFEPLYSAIDPQALDRICTRHPLDSQEGDCVVEFTYLDCQITVKSYGYIAVQPLAVE
ncbi:HalOD1 output domain-containing protein [Halosimplex aquaticum]|uniref:HalOD1 output domain-containing protein n=1 Tax=Halosimplex aquaticum TaxID=3026162 RepID=A0ABD5XTL6_9EURY